MSEELTEQQRQDLFHSTSKAIAANDYTKVNELMQEKPAEVVVDTKESPVVETKEEIKTPPVVEENKEAASDKKEPAEVVVEETKEPELSELDQLKAQLEKVAKENRDLRSQAGRVPHLQRKVSEVDKKLAEIATKQAATSSQPSDEISAVLKGVKETDPELADAILQAITKATSKASHDAIEEKKETLSFIRNQDYQEYADHEVNRLLTMVPNAKEIFADSHWGEWMKTQTPNMQNLALSDNADDVVLAFNRYAQDMRARYPELQKQEAKATPASPAVNEDAKKIEAERQRKKEAAIKVGTTNAQEKDTIPDDPDALFKYWSKKLTDQRLGK